ncbi:MAG: iron ABC transporter substrate-binding protein [Thermomicrobiales bacterium]|nr:iron ABC transporter substrate-binding protein [Thermomicrobiales bacterium]
MDNRATSNSSSRVGFVSLDRRRLLAMTGAGAVALSLGRMGALAQGSPEAAGGSITVYSGRSEGLVGPVLEMFTEATGIAVEARYGNTAEMAAAILEEGENSPADVYYAQDAGALGAVEAAGFFADLPAETLDVVDPRFRSVAGQWIGITGRARVLAYNTDELTDADLPSSVHELTGEEWNGNVGWAPTNASFQSFITAMRVTEGEDAARAWLQAMIDNGAVVFDGNGDIVRAVAAGEISTGLVNNYYVYEIGAEAGDDFPAANHFFAGGDIGSLVNISGLGILGTASNPEGALALANYLLSEEAQTYFAESTFEYPLLAGVPTAEGLPALADLESPDIDLSSLSDLEGTLTLLADVGLV